MNSSNVVLLVNADSPAGREVVKMYREFHPQIRQRQIVYLSGLVDSASPAATPADEIITRADFETYIAQPTRDHLVAYGMVDRTYIIITTAGMPYRIEDTDPAFASVVGPASSNATLAVANRSALDAASVESDLSVLFQIDPALDEAERLEVRNRLVNPYQGYQDSVKDWAADRDILGTRSDLHWDGWAWRIQKSPKFEGNFHGSGYTSSNRAMCAASMYLVARLDGPRASGEYPVFAVREMLKRAAAVSDPQSPYFTGYSSALSVVALDYAPAGGNLQYAASYNIPSSTEWLTRDEHPTPPGAETFDPPWQQGDHYVKAYCWLTDGSTPDDPILSVAPIDVGLGGTVYYDATSGIMNQSFIGVGEGIIGLLTFGRNGYDGRPPGYLLTSGPGGGPLFDCACGAFFVSIESFNAVTMFTDASTGQGKIVDFITIGGSAAFGHSFEPEAFAQIQGDYVLRNYLRDENGNGVGDLTIIEAAYTGLPYLSWTEVFIGDPLMRLRAGPGGTVDLSPRPGDVDEDGYVGFYDMLLVLASYGSTIGEAIYHVPADLTRDGFVDGDDLTEVMDSYGTDYGV